ncbi:MAG TPA: diacylglycerol kinase family protein [Chthonomonadaceae bacterium]|nr:diacylglycerol kinase family protein [Chthonomonadaceae bacterium]
MDASQAGAAPIRRAVIILNPVAGRGQGARRRAELERLLIEIAANSSVEWSLIPTQAPGHASALAAEAAAQGAEVIAAAGGDGTLGEVVNGLAGTGARLGVLPMGTGNDFARSLGLGTDLREAVHALFFGSARSVDLGRTQGRWFINVAGCGFDAAVAERVNRGFRSLRGTPAYIAAVLQSLLTFRPAAMRLTADGQTHELRAMMCTVANAPTYGGGMRIAPEAQIDDGLFDICLLADAGRIELLLAFPRVFRGTHVTHPKVTMLRARHIHIECDPPLPALVDGEVVGTTPAEFTLTPRAIEVIAPGAPGRYNEGQSIPAARSRAAR